MRPCNSLNIFFDPGHISIAQCVTLMAEAGYRHLDFNFWDWVYRGSPLAGPDWKAWVGSAVDEANRLGVAFTQAHGPVFDFTQEDEECAWQKGMALRCLEGCSMADIPWMVFHPVTVPGAGHAENLSRNAAFFRWLLAQAERFNVGIAIENMGYDASATYCAGAPDLVELVDVLNHPLAGICWDTGHALLGRRNQYDDIRLCGRRLVALHLQDGDGVTDQHYCPFYGRCDWQGITRALREIGFGNDLTFEVASFARGLPRNMVGPALQVCQAAGETLLHMIQQDE